LALAALPNLGRKFSIYLWIQLARGQTGPKTSCFVKFHPRSIENRIANNGDGIIGNLDWGEENAKKMAQRSPD
jgi:hypothetical protein